MSDSEMTVEDYSEKAIVVRGDTKPHKNELKKLGGKYNPSLRDGNTRSPGWIFSKKCEANVLEYICSGKITVPDWGKMEKRSEYKSKQSIDLSSSNEIVKIIKKIDKLYEKVASINKNLEKLNTLLMKRKEDNGSDSEIIEIESSSDEEEPELKRLLK